MHPKFERVATRLRDLIKEGAQVAALERKTEYTTAISDKIALHSWLVKSDNIIQSIFGENSPHFKHLNEAQKKEIYQAYQVNKIIGILAGALDDLENGFLVGQENLIAGIVLDSVLEQAKMLCSAGFKDPAAVLGRVVIEDLLQRLCREEGLSDSGKASVLNDSLRDKGRYTKPQWRIIQSWLDIGNAAAHGKFSDYEESNVNQMLSDIERFMAQEFGS